MTGDRLSLPDYSGNQKTEWHHIIPRELGEKYPNLSKVIEIEDDDNLIELQSHQGSHPAYTADIESKIFKSSDPSGIPGKVRVFLEQHDRDNYKVGYHTLDEMIRKNLAAWQDVLNTL
ncbi:MAG: AHH domain-containing protein [Planctomycetaceae bacterium]|nr:AHH domain-containing protein [Planctomycetaceae bacterium]